jgi:ApaG protein
MYEKVTRNICVSVKPFYLEEQSSPDEDRFVWAYRVNIENRGDDTVQLMQRHWRITDKHGRLQEVKGPGVVGEQPVLKPGESFEYTSGCPLETPSGIMAGSYEMTTPAGETFDIEIPAFSLDSPYDNAPIN